MRPAVLGSPGTAPPEDEGPVMVKLEDSEEESEAAPWDLGPEAARLCFRCFHYEEAIEPQEALAQLRELCHQWLQPEVHSKEQMLELLVLEQFLGALPSEIQALVQRQRPGNPEEAAALVDRLRRELGRPRRWVTVQVQGQEVLSEKMEPSSFHSLPQSKPQTPEPGPETPPGAMQRSPLLSLQVKEEPEVTEDPEPLDFGPLAASQEAAPILLPEEAQGCGAALDQAFPHSKMGPEWPSWRQHPGALWHEETGGIFSPGAETGAGAAPALGQGQFGAAVVTCVARCSANAATCCGTRRSTRVSDHLCAASAAAASAAAHTCYATS
ncbi:PREDICTED: myeloid zinc finger 1 isoform X2 [Propithecus coquereli]|uniref:Myeloid zinc finger 1 n=1 Tax=Propithecus coquereli TaxID=379532 RepID=A0A2K6GVD7_PROCO|nr:PREDICTED: myeloid zinc finger 1 isoform X2 [Propithecus coquereli]